MLCNGDKPITILKYVKLNMQKCYFTFSDQKNTIFLNEELLSEGLRLNIKSLI